MELLGLQDVPLNGFSLTFFSSGPSGIHRKLYWFIISSEAGGWCPNMIQRAVFRMLSDNIPIVLSSGQFLSGLRPFRFFYTWCKDIKLQNLVSNLWHVLDLSSSSLQFKFSQLRAKIWDWQSVRYSSSVSRSRECELELSSLLCSPLPQNIEELECFVSKKRELSLELHHHRLIEDQ